jgi:hypothetical protein
LRKEISKGGENIFSLKGFFGVKNADEQEREKSSVSPLDGG